MFWVYFARDFYRAGQSSEPRETVSAPYMHALLVTVVVRRPVEEAPAHPSIPVNTAPPAARPAVNTLAQPDESSIAPLPTAAYLQRLSVEGDHAFGIWDADAGFSLFSANFDRITGLASGECAGHDWIHAIHHDHQYTLNEALLSAADRGQDNQCLVQATSRFGEENWRWLLIDIKAPRGKSGTMVLWRDVTEQKALEDELAQTQSALALSERSRAAFLSAMSHELRTPLNAIMGFSEMMKSGIFGPLENSTYAQYTHHIHDSGSTLLGKINDLLDIASMDAGGLAVEPAAFLLPELLAEVVEMHSHHAFTRSQHVKLDCPLPLELEADRAKLLCAINHLTANALRHSAEGAEVTLTVRLQPGEGLIISVRDAGEGIPATQLETIRDALAANVAYFKIESGGIGLGLSLTKELTERHGGKVMIDSIRHRGTVVSLILPESLIVSGLPVRRRHSSLTLRDYENA